MPINWEDSTTYQSIIVKGEARGEARGEVRATQSHILLIGGQRVGGPSSDVEAAVKAIGDAARLNRMIGRVLTASDWNDLLATP